MTMAENESIRAAAFEYVARLESANDGYLRRADLEQGFVYKGRRVPLQGPQGIFKPAILSDAPLSITTVPIREGRPRPYEDEFGADGLIRYRYRGEDPRHHENEGLRHAWRQRIPIIYFHGVRPGIYLAAYPAFIVGDDPEGLTFTVAVDDARLLLSPEIEGVREDEALGRRRYVTSTVVQRLHQKDFRSRVLSAYREACAVCLLRHQELLDAAHILGDRDPRGEPWVSNGLCLCKIHHAAFDANILGVRPDLVIEIRPDVLREVDGPMLTHGLQRLHGSALARIPGSKRLKPKSEFLEIRYARFREAS